MLAKYYHANMPTYGCEHGKHYTYKIGAIVSFVFTRAPENDIRACTLHAKGLASDESTVNKFDLTKSQVVLKV